MDSEKRDIWRIRLATLSIFLLGFVAGAFALHSYHLWSAASKPTKQERFEEAFNRLGLNEEQKTEVQKIVTETREKLQRLRQESEPLVQEIRAQNDAKLQRVLTPEQWLRFQQEREKILQSEKPAASPKPLSLN